MSESLSGDTDQLAAANKREVKFMWIIGTVVVVCGITLAVTSIVETRSEIQISQAAPHAFMKLAALKMALEQFHADLGRFPTQKEGLGVLRSRVGRGSYIRDDQLLSDPWGRPFIYSYSGAGTPIIKTLGADGLPGGTGQNTDITMSPIVTWGRQPLLGGQTVGAAQTARDSHAGEGESATDD